MATPNVASARIVLLTSILLKAPSARAAQLKDPACGEVYIRTLASY
jgi:hypothetical protein